MVSSITFKKELTGKANLIFPAEKIRTFISLCLNEEENSNGNMDFTDIDLDVMKEIGNIVLNSVIGEIGNYLTIGLDYTLPEVKLFNKIDFKKDIESNEYAYILMLYITFNIDGTEVEGAIIIDLTMKSLNNLISKIDKIEDELYG
ncbi:hypothetical protein [Haloimpatiens massiliensis]|uniref:hypothetical protein n=1 Tax=Haloimpatiens massiliensis TaxID=1658110 RepID=UPI000C8264E5|nr:hypothetical protein [Haloimpatiens massiliensis]